MVWKTVLLLWRWQIKIVCLRAARLTGHSHDWCSSSTAAGPLPHTLLLPKPLPVPQPLHGPFAFIPAAARPEVGQREPRESGLNANGWLHRSCADWDMNPHISWNLSGEKQQDDDRVGKHANWGQGIQMKDFLSLNLSSLIIFVFVLSHCGIVYYLWIKIHHICRLFMGLDFLFNRTTDKPCIFYGVAGELNL